MGNSNQKKDTNRESPASIKSINRLIHEPARLIIMAHLYVVESAEVLFIQKQTGLTWGNLSSHIGKLEEEGLINVEKKFQGKKPQTMLHLTQKGRKQFEEYRLTMKHVFGD